MNIKIKEAVLALADTDPDLANELIWVIGSSPNVRKADINDAREVFKDLLSDRLSFKPGDVPARLFDKGYEKAEVKNIPISKTVTHYDWGRRPKGKKLERPIIVFKDPKGKYVVLDGQHRVFAKKEQGETKIEAIILGLEYKKFRRLYKLVPK